MAARYRALGFGSAAVLVLTGAICAVLVEGPAGQALAVGLILAGLGGGLLLLFLEVGLSEDRERAHEAKRRERHAARLIHRRPARRRWPRRPP